MLLPSDRKNATSIFLLTVFTRRFLDVPMNTRILMRVIWSQMSFELVGIIVSVVWRLTPITYIKFRCTRGLQEPVRLFQSWHGAMGMK